MSSEKPTKKGFNPLKSTLAPKEKGKANVEDNVEDNDDSFDTEEGEVQELIGSIEHSLPAIRESFDSEPARVPLKDPLRKYLEDIRQYPLLDPVEEMKLAMELKETGSIHAAKMLVSANLRLVVKIAFEYRSIYTNILDIIQEGNIGLMKAVSKFDPTKGARLGYYASWWIRSYILKYLLDNFRLVRVGTTQAQKKLFYHLMREKQKLEAQGLLAGPKLLAEKLNVREDEVVEMQQRLSSGGAEMSLDAPLDAEDNKVTRKDILPDDAELADDVLAREELLNLLSAKLPRFESSLKEIEKIIVRDRLLAEEPKTLQEIATQYQLTRERVRQIESKILTDLREFLRKDLPEVPKR